MKLFKCPVVPDNIKLNITIQGCAKNHFLSNKQALSSQYRYLAIFQYCQFCEIGAKNLKNIGKELTVYKRQTKVCDLFKIAPDQCKSEEYNGVFARTKNQYNAWWSNKKYCSPECGIIYNNLIFKGLIK